MPEVVNNLSMYPSDESLVPIAIAAHQEGFIADLVCPRLAPMPDSDFQYTKRTINNALGGVGTTKVSRRGEVGSIDIRGVKVTDSTEDYGLKTTVSQRDHQRAARMGIDANGEAVEEVMDVVLTDRERRVRDLIFNPATYRPSLVEVLPQGGGFADPTVSPIDVIEDLMNSMPYRANTMTIGRNDLSILRRNPFILKGFHGNDGDAGMASLQYIMDLFGLRRINVGVAFTDLDGPEGNLENTQRLWDGGLSLSHLADNTGRTPQRMRLTFAATAVFGQRVAHHSMTHPGQSGGGIHGATTVVAGESVKEFIPADFCGAYINNPSGN